MFTSTIIQVGLAIVFVILKSPFYELVFHLYIRPDAVNEQIVFHDLYMSSHMPYFVSSMYSLIEGGQVCNDMQLWESKSFPRKMFMKVEQESDQIMIDWLNWSTQFYQGCSRQQ